MIFTSVLFLGCFIGRLIALDYLDLPDADGVMKYSLRGKQVYHITKAMGWELQCGGFILN